MFKKKLSICVTYYNQKKFVRGSLDSVLSINFPCDYEVLIGDDGSNDGTVNVVNEYKNQYPDKIKIFVMDRNENSKTIGRASLNRLNLVENAIGDFIMFLDGDDFYCDREFVKDALKVFENNEKIVACAFNFKMVFDDNSREERHSLGFQNNIVPVKKYIKKYYNPSGAFVFKNVFKQHKNKVDFLRKIDGVFDDCGITLYFLQFGDLYYIDRDIYVYRQNSDSLWNKCDMLEQNIINAIFVKPMLEICPKYKFDIIKRYYGNIKYVWKRRKIIIDSLSKEKYEKYCIMAKQCQDDFILNILMWKDIKIYDKMRVFFKKNMYFFINRIF